MSLFLFPSWTSRVRSPSPAPAFSITSRSCFKSVLQNTPLSLEHGGFHAVQGFLADPKRGFAVDVEIHVHRVPELVCYDLWIKLQFSHQRRVSAPHHLEIHPVEVNCLASRFDPARPTIVFRKRSFPVSEGKTHSKMAELGSVRQVLLWFRRKRLCLPTRVFDEPGGRTVWKLPVYNAVLRIRTNPIYAGAYAFGKTEVRTRIVQGRACKTTGHHRPRTEWTVLIQEHDAGYIPWKEHERNLAMIAANSHMKSRMEPRAGRGSRALRAGILRCYRCGRMLHVSYTGPVTASMQECRCGPTHIDDLIPFLTQVLAPPKHNHFSTTLGMIWIRDL
jgi:Recombinase